MRRIRRNADANTALAHGILKNARMATTNMNLFILDEHPDLNAEYHIDKHIVKMPTEVAQMMTTTVWVDHLIGYVPRKLDSDELAIISNFKREQPDIEERTFTRFLPTHINHPCSIWMRTSLDNYLWAFVYGHALNREWQYRYGHSHDHKSFTATQNLPDLKNLPSLGLTPFAQAMPDAYKVEGNAVEAYRKYYINDKAPIASWKNQNIPYWWEQT